MLYWKLRKRNVTKGGRTPLRSLGGYSCDGMWTTPIWNYPLFPSSKKIVICLFEYTCLDILLEVPCMWLLSNVINAILFGPLENN